LEDHGVDLIKLKNTFTTGIDLLSWLDQIRQNPVFGLLMTNML